MTQSRNGLSATAAVHAYTGEKSQIWVILESYGGYARAKIKHRRNAAAQTLAGHLLSLARSVFSVFLIIGTHAHTRVCARACVCVCAVFDRHCSRAPGYTSRPLIYYTTYLSRAHLLSDLALAQHTHTHTRARRLPPPPSYGVHKRRHTHTNGGRVYVLRELATHTHMETTTTTYGGIRSQRRLRLQVEKNPHDVCCCWRTTII